ncbi:hypothetical protein [Stenotrophomonas maltophilia]|uniref:hypothetical protein n=1 Tax=Stenotrophomonas maltophilia TaxID=40324 RepID=UPI0015DE0B8B|nr:hypothetical protein [Stenotrophomonas maltophilia]
MKSRQERGRWRAGRHFTRQGETIDVADLKKGQLDAIKSDPELIVQDVETKAKGEPSADEAAIAREKAATKNAGGKKAWGEAEVKAQAAAGLDAAAWEALAPAERVPQIEAHLGKDV